MKKKKITSNLLASIFAILSFVMMVVILIYFIVGKVNKTITIILFSFGGACVLLFLVFTVVFLLEPPSLKNKK